MKDARSGEPAEVSEKEDAIRLIEHQIDQIRHYEHRAERLLRLYVGAIGLSLSLIGLFATFGNFSISDTSSLINSEKISSIIAKLSSDFPISEANSTLIVLLIGFSGFLLIPAVTYWLLLKGLSHAKKVIDPVELKVVNRSPLEKNNTGNLQRVIEYNDEKLSSKRESLEKSIEIGALSIAVPVFGTIVFIAPLVLATAEGTILSFGALLIITSLLLYDYLSSNNFPKPIYPKLDVILMMATALLLITMNVGVGDLIRGVLQVMALAIVFSIAVVFDRLEYKIKREYVYRNVILAIFVFTLWTLVIIGTEDPIFEPESWKYYIVPSAIIGLLSTAVIGICAGFIQYLTRIVFRINFQKHRRKLVDLKYRARKRADEIKNLFQ